MITYLAVSKLIKKNNLYNTIVSTFFITKDQELLHNNHEFIQRMNLYNFNNLQLIHIINEREPTIDRMIDIKDENNNSITFNFIKIFIDDFFEKESFYKIMYNFDSKDIILRFQHLKYREIAAKFRVNDVIISGGSNTKKHILSPVQFTMSQFISCLLGSSINNIEKSFYIIGNNEISRSKIDFTRKEIKDYLDNVK